MAKHERSKSQDDVLRHPSVKRAKEIDASPPFEQLEDVLGEQKTDHAARNILHWFRSKDLRMQDNNALSKASEKAKEASKPLLTAYMFSPEDMEWHGTSPARTDFILQTLQLLKDELAKKHIPLAIITAEKRADKTNTIVEFVKKHDISHVYANFEYEVDELRRDIKLAKHLAEEKDVSVEIFHDQTIVPPGELTGGAGTPVKVFTPYHKAWCAEIKASPERLDLFPDPSDNDKSVAESFKELFDSKIPPLPKSKSFEKKDDKYDQKHIRKLWPAGHAAGLERLETFLKKKVSNYGATRSNPGKDSSSRMSAYFSAGIVSVREAVAAAAKHNGSAETDFMSNEDPGIDAWVREIVFREFYRHVLIHSPHDSMNMPHNAKFDYVHWEDNDEHWEKWCNGMTGMPLVDAGMRQLKNEAWMHNRARMNTASYLRTNLLLDYRRGERWFAEHLIDWDLSNNTQGWEPSYTVFNPVVQAEKNDPDGDYIRRWVPELKDVQGKAVFDPHGRLSEAEFEKLGYPAPCVNFVETKQRATERYKKDLHSHDEE